MYAPLNTVIRWCIYVQGAALIITGIGWPVQTFENMKNYFITIRKKLAIMREMMIVYKVFQFSKPKIDVTDGLIAIHKVIKRILPSDEKDEYILEQLNDVVEVSARIKLPEVVSIDLTETFHPDNIPVTAKEEDWKEEENIHGLNGKNEPTVVVIEAQTVDVTS
jgi:hypothetical protein